MSLLCCRWSQSLKYESNFYVTRLNSAFRLIHSTFIHCFGLTIVLPKPVRSRVQRSRPRKTHCWSRQVCSEGSFVYTLSCREGVMVPAGLPYLHGSIFCAFKFRISRNSIGSDSETYSLERVHLRKRLCGGKDSWVWIQGPSDWTGV